MSGWAGGNIMRRGPQKDLVHMVSGSGPRFSHAGLIHQLRRADGEATDRRSVSGWSGGNTNRGIRLKDLAYMVSGSGPRFSHAGQVRQYAGSTAMRLTGAGCPAGPGETSGAGVTEGSDSHGEWQWATV